MLFLVLGVLAVLLGLMGIVFSISGDQENLKKYVGTQNRRLAALLGSVGVAVGSEYLHTS